MRTTGGGAGTTGTPVRGLPRPAGLPGALAAAATLVALTGCAGPPPAPTEPLDMVEFAAEGPDGAAFGSYVLLGDLVAPSATTFTGLPFSARLPAPGTVSPKMSVSVVDARPGSRVTCRISLNGEVLVENSGDVPGQDVECVAPTMSTEG